MDLYSILACPVCKGDLQREEALLMCRSCGREYPIVDGVPMLLPDGSIPNTQYQHELLVRQDYGLWIPQLVIKSLPASAIVLNLGAGNQALDLPNVVRMDVTLTPYVDVVGDAHALPFKPGVFDFIFSLAVIEHLRQPFLAAQEMFDALRNGGYVYGDCNFVFAYHGYPHHYFNASEQGLQQIFSRFVEIRTGVAPHQMPSFALTMILTTYLQKMTESADPNVQAYRRLLQKVLDQPLMNFDALFTEDAALTVAAGVFYFGRKAVEGQSEVIPPVIQSIWEQDAEVRQEVPDLYNLGTYWNIMRWARNEGRQKYSDVDAYFQDMVQFRKNDTVDDEGQRLVDAVSAFEPTFYAMPDTRQGYLPQAMSLEAQLVLEIETITAQLEAKNSHIERLESLIDAKNDHIKRLESLMRRLESGRVMRLFRLLDRKKR